MRPLMAVVAVVLLLVFGMALQARPDSWPIDAVGRLYDDDLRQTCTAFTVSTSKRTMTVESYWYYREVVYWRNLVASAGHCAEGGSGFRYMPADLRFRQGRSYPFWAYLVGYSGNDLGHDVAILAVDSSEPFGVLNLKDEMPAVGDWVTTLGYGGGALSGKVGKVLGFDERGWMSVDNTTTKGSSGSPVLLVGTRDVVGIVVEGYLKVEQACHKDRCWDTEFYVAAPASKVKALLRMP